MDKDIKEIKETLKRNEEHLKRHEEHLIKHDKHFEIIEEQLKKHEEHLIEHDKHFERIEEHLKRHDEDLKELKEMIRSLQEAMVVVEDAVTRKLPALFDGYKMHQEKQEQFEARLDKIEEVSAEHSIRIFALEAAKK